MKMGERDWEAVLLGLADDLESDEEDRLRATDVSDLRGAAAKISKQEEESRILRSLLRDIEGQLKEAESSRNAMLQATRQWQTHPPEWEDVPCECADCQATRMADMEICDEAWRQSMASRCHGIDGALGPEEPGEPQESGEGSRHGR